MGLTIENKRMVCELINSLPVYEEESEYLLKDITNEMWSELLELGVPLKSLFSCTDEEGVTDVTRLMFENDYADLYSSNKGFIVFDEKVSFDDGEFLVCRVGNDVSIGKFNGDIYDSVTLEETKLFELTMLLMAAQTHGYK